MAIPARQFAAGSDYRYGFNGKEKDKDMNSLTAYDYGFRIYNPGLGKFLSVDPVTKNYPELTPYQFGSNCPISGIDIDGLEYYYAADGTFMGKIGKETTIKILDVGMVLSINYGAKVKKESVPDYFSKLFKTEGAKINRLSKEAYSNLDDAAADFSLMNGSISIVKNEERTARIGSVQFKDKNGKVTNKTAFVLGSTVVGESEADINSSNLFGTKLAAGVHTHGKDPRIPGVHVDNFSGKDVPESFRILSGDMDWAKKNGVPIYLSNPIGELKVFIPKSPYETGDENGIIIRRDMPYDIYRQAPYKVQPRRPAYNPSIVYDENREPTEAEAIPYKLPQK